jgi:hypothetical protein
VTIPNKPNRLPRAGSRAIVTLALGDSHPLWEVSHPTMRGYADAVGADYMPIIGPALDREALLDTKIQEIYRQLGNYERVMFIDGDVVVHPNCPDVFDMVPKENVGATDEGHTDLLLSSRQMRMKVYLNACKYYGADTSAKNTEELEIDPSYVFFNSGVMVLSHLHRDMFLPSQPVKRIGPWVDMPFLNAMRTHRKHPFTDLGFKYNYIGSMAYHDDRPYDPKDAWIVHGSGGISAVMRKRSKAPESKADSMAHRVEFLSRTLESWKSDC